MMLRVFVIFVKYTSGHLLYLSMNTLAKRWCCGTAWKSPQISSCKLCHGPGGVFIMRCEGRCGWMVLATKQRNGKIVHIRNIHDCFILVANQCVVFRSSRFISKLYILRYHIRAQYVIVTWKDIPKSRVYRGRQFNTCLWLCNNAIDIAPLSSVIKTMTQLQKR